jgi:protein-tyrosine phosphatase
VSSSFENELSADVARLTKQYEGGLLKCGNYWGDQQYGPLHVHLVSQTGGEDHVQQQTTGFDFGMAAATPREDESEEVESNIRRTFVLTHDQYKDQPPRTIIQIQCVAWPDFDVPDNPDILLSLIKDTDNAVEEAMKRPCDDRAELAPVLVHCECECASLRSSGRQLTY